MKPSTETAFVVLVFIAGIYGGAELLVYAANYATNLFCAIALAITGALVLLPSLVGVLTGGGVFCEEINDKRMEQWLLENHPDIYDQVVRDDIQKKYEAAEQQQWIPDTKLLRN